MRVPGRATEAVPSAGDRRQPGRAGLQRACVPPPSPLLPEAPCGGKLNGPSRCRGTTSSGSPPPTAPAASRRTPAPFFEDMPERLAAAHLVIARRRASTIAELANAGRPAILVPYPQRGGRSSNRATPNALSRPGGGWLMPQKSLHAGKPVRAAERKLLAEPPRGERWQGGRRGPARLAHPERRGRGFGRWSAGTLDRPAATAEQEPEAEAA